MSSSRPRGRRPGASDTRDTILAAARERFARFGYDRTRIRDVAEDAGVDAALVHYFFRSKDGLFAAAMQLPFSPAEVIGPVLEAGVDGAGERIVRRVLEVWDDPGNRTTLLALIQGASAHPGAAAALGEFVRREIVGRIAGAVRADRAELRANLVASQIIGLVAVQRGCEPPDDLAEDELAQSERRARVAGGAADQPEQRRAVLVPHREHPPHHSLAEPVDALGQDRGDDLGRPERQLHGGREQPVLGLEEVVDQRGVDAGVGRHVADPSALVADGGEALARGRQDGLARIAGAGPPATWT